MNQPFIVLAGNPNTGKSTLFNSLTGKHQSVGNWPGVTVEQTIGSIKHEDQCLSLVDLPGTYSLSLDSSEQAIDERIACETILSGEVDLVVNVIDGTNLQRHLYLSLQLLEMGVPMLVVVNKMDSLEKQGINLDLWLLSERLGVPVVGVVAQRTEGMKELKDTLVKMIKKAKVPKPVVKYSDTIEKAIKNSVYSRWKALDEYEFEHEDADIEITDSRFSVATSLAELVVSQPGITTQQNALDKIVLHRIWGIPIFLGVMYCLFLLAIDIGGAFQDFFDIGSSTIFVSGTTKLLQYCHAPHWLIVFLAQGAGRGINTTLSFVPVIGSMFFLLAFLESSGYMARAAFVVDRLMRFMGLPGKSFVPMIVGFGCNVPGIMATRTIENQRDRILTIMMSPFMSCGARLAIYAIFTAAFFPTGGQNIVFLLYLIGILMAVLTGLLLRKTVLKGEPGELVMEMPTYHWPKLSLLWRQSGYRLKRFIVRAGSLIVPVCMLLGVLNHIDTPGKPEQSVLETLGKTATPIFSPMGIASDNWPSVVGLISGVMAKEVVVGTLNTLYSQQPNPQESILLVQGLKEAIVSIPENFKQLPQHLGSPLQAAMLTHETSSGVYGEMYRHFGGRVAAFAYLLFVLLYFPCVSATVAMIRELNVKWAVFSVAWTTGVAYASAVGFYQLATVTEHWLSSLSWLAFFAIVLVFTIRQMKGIAKLGVA